MNDSEKEIKTEMDVESKKQALADYLRIDPKKISACSVRLNNLVTFQWLKAIYIWVPMRR